MIVEGEHSHGGELGHMRIEMPDRGRLCGCGARGCLEAYASATNVVRRAREEMACFAQARPKLRDYYTANDDDFTAKIIFDLADGGDELAAEGGGRHRVLPGARGVRGDRDGGPGDDRLRRRDGRGRRVVPREDRGVREAVRAAVPDEDGEDRVRADSARTPGSSAPPAAPGCWCNANKNPNAPIGPIAPSVP